MGHGVEKEKSKMQDAKRIDVDFFKNSDFTLFCILHFQFCILLYKFFPRTFGEGTQSDAVGGGDQG